MKGIPNKLLLMAVEALEKYRVLDYPKLAFDIPGPAGDKKLLGEVSGLRSDINELQESFESLKISTKIDNTGFVQFIQKNVDKVTRRKQIKG
ncbi:MAG: hypothetical protein WAT79_11825 [Saprospiraceae bacterium]